MALATYTDLKASVAGWLHRNNLDGVAADFITLTEARIKADLAARSQDVVAALACVMGADSVPLPADFLRMRALSIPGYLAALDYVTPEQLAEHAGDAAGLPRRYTILAGALYLAPVPDAAYSLRAIYQGQLVPLSDSAPTNAVLTAWPNLYLWGALVEASTYSRNDEFLTLCEGRYQQALTGVNKTESNASGPLRVRADTWSF